MATWLNGQYITSCHHIIYEHVVNHTTLWLAVAKVVNVLPCLRIVRNFSNICWVWRTLSVIFVDVKFVWVLCWKSFAECVPPCDKFQQLLFIDIRTFVALYSLAHVTYLHVLQLLTKQRTTESSKNAATALSRMNFSGYVGHVTSLLLHAV